MLVGDAAGMVSPATGGGIRFAFRYGRRAAQLIAIICSTWDRLRSACWPPNCRASY